MFKRAIAHNSVGALPELRPWSRNALAALFFFIFQAVCFVPGIVFSAPAEEHQAATLSAAAPAAALPPQVSTDSLVVNLSVNLVPKGDFFAELDSSGLLYLRPEDFDALQLLYDESRTVLIRGERYVPVAAVRESSSEFDEKRLTLSFMGKITTTGTTAIEVFSLNSRPKNLYIPRETSAFLNYALSSTSSDGFGFDRCSATTKIGARTGDIFAISDGIYTKTRLDDRFVRLQTSATYERRDELQWFVLGDRFASSGELGGMVNIGGVGVTKVFRLDPYYITQPVFNIQGTTQFPSQAEIYIDGSLVNRQSLMPGAFELKNLYSYNGAHNVELVMRDPFGNEQRISLPAYFSAAMLREGLHEYGYHAGFLRERYGIESNDYGKPVFSAFHRYGLSNSLNIGGRAEGMGGLLNAGLSAQYAHPRFGAVSLSAAGSDANDLRGSAGMVQHAFQMGSVTTNLFVHGYSKGYATLSQPSGGTDASPRIKTSLSAGFPVHQRGSISLSYAASKTHGGQTNRVASANYSRGLTKTSSLFATASETRLSTQPDAIYAIFLGVQISLDGNIRGAVQLSRTGDTNAQSADIQKSPPIGEGVGYRALLSRTETGSSSSQSFNPAIQYNGRYGIFSADSTFRDFEDDVSTAHVLSWSGSLVYAGGFFGASRPVSDSFAIVSVDKAPNTVVRNNGQEIGTTSGSGDMIVPTVTSYGQNQITLDVADIPLDYSVTGVNKVLSPSIWSGSCIAFDAVKTQAVAGRIVAVDEQGSAPVEYQEATLPFGAWTATFPTGKGGEFYLETTLPSAPDKAEDSQSCRSIMKRRSAGNPTMKPGVYRGEIFSKGKKCLFEITIPETEDPISDLGEIRCGVKKEAPEPPAPPEPEPQQGLPPAATPVENDPPRSVVASLRHEKQGVFAGKNEQKAVAALVRHLKKNPGFVVVIEVFGGRPGAEKASKRAGLKQIDAIRKYLISQGILPDQIKSAKSSGQGANSCSDASSVCDKAGWRGVLRLERSDSAAQP